MPFVPDNERDRAALAARWAREEAAMDRRNAAAVAGSAKHRKGGGGLCGVVAIALLAVPTGLLYCAWRAWQAVAGG